MRLSLHKIFPSLFLILFTFCICYSQPYQSLFGSQYTSWNTYYEIPDAGFTDSIVSENDTVINGKMYKNIIKYGGWGGGGGFLREDTIEGKAWFINKYDTVEYLIMNLELALNDSFMFYNSWSGSGMEYVDSVYLENGKKHIRFNVDSDSPLVFDSAYPYDTPIEFIEGIGTNIGIEYQNHYMSPLVFGLLCASKNGQNIFQPFSFCRYDWMGINEKENYQKIKISPNPFNNTAIIVINKDIFLDCRFTIYDLFGRKVKEFAIHESPYTFYRNNLTDGIYFYQAVTDKNKIIANGKMVIQ